LQRDVSRKSSSHQVCNDLRDERLTAVRDAHDSRRAVDGSAKEVAVTLLDHAGMDAAAHLELNALGRVRVRERREELDRGIDSLQWVRECGVNAVASRLDDRPAG